MIGARILDARPMTKEELSEWGWTNRMSNSGYALVLDNGVILYPGQDFEGNGQGVIFGKDKSGVQFVLT
jgi:hypothetical protein